VASLSDPLGRTTRARLDRSGRPLVVTDAEGGVTTLTRDSNGWVTEQVDPLGRVTDYTLDSAGYPTLVTLPDGHTLGYVYQSSHHSLKIL